MKPRNTISNLRITNGLHPGNNFLGGVEEEEEVPMYERAAQQQKVAQLKVEKLRREKFEKEMEQQRKPQISRQSRKLISSNKDTIYVRMEKLEQAKKKKLAKLQEEKEERENKEMRQPELSLGKKKQKEMKVFERKATDPDEKSKTAPRETMSSDFQKRQDALLAKKEAKIKEELEKKEINEMKECNFSPKIPDSEEILEKAKKRKDAELVALIQAEAISGADPKSPKSELYAAALAGDIHARLALEAKEKRRNQELAEKKQMDEIKKLATPDLTKDLSSLTPKKRSTSPKPPRAISPEPSPTGATTTGRTPPKSVSPKAKTPSPKRASPVAQKTSPASSPTAVSPKPKRASKWGAVKTEMVDKPKEEKEKRKSTWFAFNGKKKG
ncbi:hypothetical protein TL16_g06552 [Triparma laevis f. inornata]|uniref:Uncharacterized protein n=2 Tax=Triparma laevis TaxID=1534972 RepID=A0A9W7C323_9STRA|nr:hypothetical protein TL16_g06552 [Triparma laevis f. inornata]GMI02327.1 hypothetical protein TrLO_g7416 [Triparma laevis f. longispina]